MRYQRFHKNPHGFVELIESKVPFMNGGLFECLDHQDDEKKGKKGGAIINYEDGFSDRKDNELFVPDYIFFGKDVKVDLSSEYDDKKKRDVTVNGIINILQKYKFTIAENTPVEQDSQIETDNGINYNDNSDGIIDSLFAQQTQEISEVVDEDDVTSEHVVDPDDFALYKKYLG